MLLKMRFISKDILPKESWREKSGNTDCFAFIAYVFSMFMMKGGHANLSPPVLYKCGHCCIATNHLHGDYPHTFRGERLYLRRDSTA